MHCSKCWDMSVEKTDNKIFIDNYTWSYYSIKNFKKANEKE